MTEVRLPTVQNALSGMVRIMQGKPTVLLVEDDDGHAFLLKSSLRKAGFQNNVRRFSDGQEVLDFLREMPASSEPLGVVTLLDIRMPRLDGVEALKQIRADPRFTDMPVIMVTTTDDPGEMHRCMQLGCDAFLVKPMDWKQFTTRLSALAGFFSQGHRENENHEFLPRDRRAETTIPGGAEDDRGPKDSGG